jgi:integrase
MEESDMAGNGTIRQRGKDSWELSVSLGKGNNGKYIRKTKNVKAKNKTEAKELLRRFIFEVETGDYTNQGNVLFKEVVFDWKKKHLANLAIRTQQGYESNLTLRVLPFFGHLKISSIKKFHLQNFFDSLMEDGARMDGKDTKLSNSHINNHHVLLGSIFSFAVDRGYIKESPLKGVKKLKTQKKKMNIYQKSELVDLMNHLNEEPLLWKVLVTLAILSGAREGELVALEWKHINFEKEIITIEQSLTLKVGEGIKVKTTKTDRSRIVSIPPSMVQLLKEYKHEKNKERLASGEWIEEWEGVKRDFIFTAPGSSGRPLRPDSVSQWWSRFLKKNDEIKRITFHGLRHTSVSLLIDEKNAMKVISERVGHAKISTTMDIYGHLLEDADKKAADSLNKVFDDLGIKIAD